MRRLAAVTTLMVLAVPTWQARAEATCAPAAHAGGEWRSYGGDAANTRSQPSETKIGPDTVANLTSAWVINLSSVQAGAAGTSATPVIADGCLYVTDRAGYVFAFNADTSEMVWKSQKLPGAGQSLYASVITGSPAIGDDLVYVAVSRENSQSNSYVAALDRSSGALVWTSRIPMFDTAGKALTGHTAIATPVLYDGVLLQAMSAPEGGANARGGWVVLDPSREGAGRIIARDYSVPDIEWDAGYRGASVWCTPALDAETGFAYACGGNPANKNKESRNSNALLKIDLRRTVGGQPNPTFGKLVDSYKGDVDQYYPGLDRQPACDMFGEIGVVWGTFCLQLDLDFGASPSVFTVNGEKMVGDLQKSGVYHALYAETMSRAWTAIVGAPCFCGNSSSNAVDGERVYAAGSPPGQLAGLTKDRGRTQWVVPVGSGFHYQSVSTANGVAYTIDGSGNLSAVDGETGLVLARRPLSQDTGSLILDYGSNGVAIARNTVYAAAGSWIVAYR